MEITKIFLAALQGIASCGTACDCCRMHQRIASKALANACKCPANIDPLGCSKRACPRVIEAEQRAEASS